MAAKKAQSKAKSTRGGRRPGAGRKTKAATKLRAELVAEADKGLSEALPRLVQDLLKLAHGGYERVEESWEPAGLVTVVSVVRDADGEPCFGPSGAAVTATQPAFPDKDPTELVLVSRRRSIADADRAAIQYAMDRVLGRPKQAVEHSGPEGGAIPVSFEQALTKIYGAPECDTPS